jgi:diguanylate cyclase (GGDEF)-like protein/PAS domain S-box-containing protein
MSSNQSNFEKNNLEGIDANTSNYLPVGLFYTDLSGLCIYANDKWLEMAGLTLEEVLADGWSNAIHVDDRERVYAEWIDAVKNDRPFVSEYRFQKQDKTTIWVIGQANKYKDNDGNDGGYVGTITDITERKNTETSLRLLSEGFSVTDSSEFFQSLSIHLGKRLDVDYVVVGEINGENCDVVKSVIVNHRGTILEPLMYSLQGTPCETVINHTVNGFESGTQNKFPEFDLLKALNVEGYVGTTLFNSSNEPIGLIAVLNSKPINNLQKKKDVLQIYAMRAAAELERKQREVQLEHLNKELEFKQYSVENIFESIFWTDESINIVDVNEAACRSLGYSRDELLQLTIFDIDPNISESELLEVRRKRKALKKQGEKNVFETCHKTKDGHIFPVEITASIIEFGGKEYHCSIVRDISERKANEKEREKRLSLQKAVFEATADGILVTDKNQCVSDYNQKFVDIWNLEDKDLTGKAYSVAIPYVSNQLKDPESFVNRIQEIYKDEEEDSFDILELKDGRVIERVSRPQYLMKEVVGRVWSFRDITEKHKLSEQLSYQANHDALTGLVNRREFEKRLLRVISKIEPGTEHVMCYMDLDNFKQINDFCGHIAGDFLLKQISDLFQQNVRGRDTLARLGGDEFGLIMEYCTIEQAKKIANNFITLINESSFTWEDKPFDIGVSIGIVSITGPTQGMLEVIKNADVACYTAKKTGRNCVHVSTS